MNLQQLNKLFNEILKVRTSIVQKALTISLDLPEGQPKKRMHQYLLQIEAVLALKPKFYQYLNSNLRISKEMQEQRKTLIEQLKSNLGPFWHHPGSNASRRDMNDNRGWTIALTHRDSEVAKELLNATNEEIIKKRAIDTDLTFYLQNDYPTFMSQTKERKEFLKIPAAMQLVRLHRRLIKLEHTLEKEIAYTDEYTHELQHREEKIASALKRIEKDLQEGTDSKGGVRRLKKQLS